MERGRSRSETNQHSSDFNPSRYNGDGHRGSPAWARPRLSSRLSATRISREREGDPAGGLVRLREPGGLLSHTLVETAGSPGIQSHLRECQARLPTCSRMCEWGLCLPRPSNQRPLRRQRPQRKKARERTALWRLLAPRFDHWVSTIFPPVDELWIIVMKFTENCHHRST